MFARKVSALLKPDSLPEFTHVVECEILPWLRNQEGFLDLIILAVLDSREVATISFWDHHANAEAFHEGGYPEVLEILGKLLDGTPYVKTFDVVSSTFEKAGFLRAPEANQLSGNGSARRGYRSPDIGRIS